MMSHIFKDKDLFCSRQESSLDVIPPLKAQGILMDKARGGMFYQK